MAVKSLSDPHCLTENPCSFFRPALKTFALVKQHCPILIASRSLVQRGPVHALQLIEGLRHPVLAQRRAQWQLCGLYAVCTMAVITLADWVDDGMFDELQRLMAQGNEAKASARLDVILASPELVQGMLVRFGLAGLLAVPFWHAPALVHWGGQGLIQALFTSSVAIWRTRGAFTVYLLGWAGLMLAVALAVALLAMLTGARQVLGVLTMPIGLVFSAAFYISLWFSFTDTFGQPDTRTTP